ncbi:MAG: hypothetical protein H6712_33765 [Myxococcales bacterium]|nr:hypothetical protein [Myxococcales bacterium]
MERLGHLPFVRARLVYYPDHREDFEDALTWTPENIAGAEMRLAIDAYDAFARVVAENTGDRVPVDDLVATLMVIAFG